MYRLSLVINEIYNKYLPLAERAGISLNLDFPDPTVKVKEPEKVKAHLDKHIDSALKRTIKGEISINVSRGKIILKDTGTVLSQPMIALLTSEHVSVKSRVGFGTTVTISFD